MRIAVLSGILAGVLAEIAFLALHALVIVPIWWSAFDGLAFAVVCGALIGAGLERGDASRRSSSGTRAATAVAVLRTGAFLWGPIAITTILVQLGRRLPVPPHELVEVAMSILAAALYGARRGGIGGVVASVASLVAASGPFLRISAPAIQLFFGLFPVLCLYAAAFVILRRMLSACAFERFSPRSLWPFPRSRTRSSSETSTSLR